MRQDYYGQQLAEKLLQIILVTAFMISTGYGWYTQNLMDALYGWLGGLAIALIVYHLWRKMGKKFIHLVYRYVFLLGQFIVAILSSGSLSLMKMKIIQ